MRVLGLGAGGGINDEEAGLAGGNIDGTDGAEGILGAGGASIGLGSYSVPFAAFPLFPLPSSGSLLRENEGTASFGCVAADFGVTSSCSTSSSGSETCKDGASSFALVAKSSSFAFDCLSARRVFCILWRSHGGKALRVASGCL